MAFTYDITTDRGRVRFNVADTDSSAYVFEDAEIDQLLTDEGGVAGATVACLRALLTNAALRIRYFAMQGLTLDTRQQIEALRASLAEYETSSGPTVAVRMGASLPQDDAFVEPYTTSS